MIKYHQGLLLAQAVVNYISLIDPETTYFIEAYQNCREQGYIIINQNYNLDKVAYVTRSRNSDQLLVCIGESQHRGISADAYNNAKSFDPKDVFEAAKYIITNINL